MIIEIKLWTHLSVALKEKVCPEANDELVDCIKIRAYQALDEYYQDCLNYIEEIFRNGYIDLKKLLGKFYDDDKNQQSIKMMNISQSMWQTLPTIGSTNVYNHNKKCRCTVVFFYHLLRIVIIFLSVKQVLLENFNGTSG